MRTDNQIVSYTKNSVTQLWEFMVLDMENKGANLGTFEIDPDLRGLSVVDNATKSLTSYDLRKFTKMSEFKLNNKVSQFKIIGDDMMLVVSDSQISLCKVIDGSITSMVEVKPKEALKCQ